MARYVVILYPSREQINKGISQTRKTADSLPTARKIATKFIGKDTKAEVEVYKGTVGIGSAKVYQITKPKEDRFPAWSNGRLLPARKDIYHCEVFKDGRWDGQKYIDSDGKFTTP